jgi:DTW domain-containing protein YfiP
MNRRDLLKLGASVTTVPAVGVAQDLWWVDGYAIRKHNKPFAGCTSEQQTAILETLDAGTDPAAGPGHQFFQTFKGMTSEINYATQIGFNELNKGGRVPVTFGCRHPEHA